MAVVLEKVYTPVLVTFQRTNFQGNIYHVATPGFTDVVIVDGECARCTCQEANCEHIREVRRTRRLQAEQSARREKYATLFDLSYGD